MRSFLLLPLLLTACHAYPNQCRYGPIEVFSDLELDCDAMRQSGELLRKLYTLPVREARPELDPNAGYSFEENWPVPSPVERWGGFDKAFEGYVVIVENTETFVCSNKEVAGCHRGSVSSLGRHTQRFFAHESLHFLECKAGQCGNVDHLDWVPKGFSSLAEAYTFADTPVWVR